MGLATSNERATFSRGKKLSEKQSTVPGLMLVRFKEAAVRPSTGPGLRSLTRATAARLPESVAGPLQYLRANAGLKEVTPVFSQRQAGLRRAAVSRADSQKLGVLSSVADSMSEELSGITLLSLDPKSVTGTLVKRVAGADVVEYAEPMPARFLLARRSRSSRRRGQAAADPLANRQWGLRAIDWFNARIPKARKMRVAVLDTGVDRNHPDLAQIVASYFHSGLSASDIVGHGTHVAGIIGAVANNGIGICGVADCQVSVWKIFGDEPDPYWNEFFVDSTRYLRALREVVDQQVEVVNLSIGGPQSSRTEDQLFRMLERNGITVVAAMGNEYEDGNPTEYPAAYETVMAVGSISESGRRSAFSNTGKHINIVAPGSNILSTLPRQKNDYREETEYAAWSGTSMATPHVAAAAALLRAKARTSKPGAIRDRLEESAAELSGMRRRKWTPSYGHGLLNIREALR